MAKKINPFAKDAFEFGPAPDAPAKKIRRKPLKGENLKAIKQVVAQIQNEDISVQEFVTLVSPHTDDKGEYLTKVMTEDLSNFRKMVIKVYDNMTQDIGDVLANEQVNLAKMYMERLEILKEKIKRTLNDLGNIQPNFNFKKYQMNPADYLSTMFKTAEMPDQEEMESAKRHIAFHRLQWLHSEGDRLQKENNRLQQRLNELKKEQRKELKEVVKKEAEIEQENIELEETQAEMQDRLEVLNASLHEAIVVEEKKEKAKEEENEVRKQVSITSKKTSKKRVAKSKRLTIKQRPQWQDLELEDFASTTGAEIESKHIIEDLQNIMPIESTRVASPIQKLSPIRSASPVKQIVSPPQPERNVVQRQQAEQRVAAPRIGRRAQGPRDTWRGFQ